MRLLNYLVKL
jgi:protein-histidine N-methyltransferase